MIFFVCLLIFHVGPAPVGKAEQGHATGPQAPLEGRDCPRQPADPPALPARAVVLPHPAHARRGSITG